MLIKAESRKNSKNYFSSTNLVLIALSSAFFPRLLILFKIPSIVNFLHFITVPLAFGVAISTTKSKNYRQIKASRSILFAILLLLIVEFASALINHAGAINVALHFLLFNEPVLLLIAIICIPMSATTLHRFRSYVLGFGFSNLIFALIQKFVLRWDSGHDPCPNLDGVDTITGVFTCQGAGVIVSGSVSFALVSYYFIVAKNRPILFRTLVFFACLIQLVVADAKQCLIVGGVAFGLLSFANIKDIRKTILIFISAVVGFQAFWWAIFNFEFLGAFAGWVRPDLYGPNGEATRFKLFGVDVISSHMQSPINFFLGLGPGHTVDRLGMVMLKEYGDLLNPLGATRTNLSNEVWQKAAESWLANGSTMFSPFFGWVALWGDLGIFGLCAFCYLYFLIWRYICTDDLSKYQLLCIFVVGWIQAGMQEPGFMLYVASLIGLRWQELQHKTKNMLG